MPSMLFPHVFSLSALHLVDDFVFQYHSWRFFFSLCRRLSELFSDLFIEQKLEIFYLSV